jgi:hypothetical protein
LAYGFGVDKTAYVPGGARAAEPGVATVPAHQLTVSWVTVPQAAAEVEPGGDNPTAHAVQPVEPVVTAL